MIGEGGEETPYQNAASPSHPFSNFQQSTLPLCFKLCLSSWLWSIGLQWYLERSGCSYQVNGVPFSINQLLAQFLHRFLWKNSVLKVSSFQRSCSLTYAKKKVEVPFFVFLSVEWFGQGIMFLCFQVLNNATSGFCQLTQKLSRRIICHLISCVLNKQTKAGDLHDESSSCKAFRTSLVSAARAKVPPSSSIGCSVNNKI